MTQKLDGYGSDNEGLNFDVTYLFYLEMRSKLSDPSLYPIKTQELKVKMLSYDKLDLNFVWSFVTLKMMSPLANDLIYMYFNRRRFDLW